MHLRRSLFKLAVPMVAAYFFDPQMGATRRQNVALKAQRLMGRTPAVANTAPVTAGWSTSRVVSETISERRVIDDGNGLVVTEATADAARDPAD